MVQTMMGRLTYFTVELLAEDLWKEEAKGGATPEQIKQSVHFYQHIIHYVSLCFALMLKTLRKDFDLDDMYEHQPYDVRLHWMRPRANEAGWNVRVLY